MHFEVQAHDGDSLVPASGSRCAAAGRRACAEGAGYKVPAVSHQPLRSPKYLGTLGSRLPQWWKGPEKRTGSFSVIYICARPKEATSLAGLAPKGSSVIQSYPIGRALSFQSFHRAAGHRHAEPTMPWVCQPTPLPLSWEKSVHRPVFSPRPRGVIRRPFFFLAPSLSRRSQRAA